MPRPLLISSQSDYLIRVFDRNTHIWWQTVQIQISWLLQKPTDLDLHCLLRQGMSCSAREGLIMVLILLHSLESIFSSKLLWHYVCITLLQDKCTYECICKLHNPDVHTSECFPTIKLLSIMILFHTETHSGTRVVILWKIAICYSLWQAIKFIKRALKCYIYSQ